MTGQVLRNNFDLNDKYTLIDGKVVLSGIQALVRLLLDQHRADLIAGLNTATLVSGYRGSPVGVLDLNLLKNKKILDEHNVKFIPGVNEDLGATMIYGSQMANMVSKVKYDGIATDYSSILRRLPFSDILSILKENGFYVATDNGMHMHISTHKALETDKADLIEKSINHQANLITRYEDVYGYQTIDFNIDGFVAPSDLFQYNTEMEFELVQDIMLRYSKGLDHIQKFLPSSRTDNTFCRTYEMRESNVINYYNFFFFF